MGSNSNVSAIAGIYRVRKDTLVFLGSGFSLVSPEIIVTAAHCVRDVPLEELRINHFGGLGSDLMSLAESQYVEAEGDVCIINVHVESDRVRWVTPFRQVQYVAEYGQRVCAFGYPEEMDGGIHQSASLRFFRGYIQRPFLYRPSDGKPYSAYELSFPSPAGLSGAPLFLEDAPTIVVGVITATMETFAIVDEYEEEKGANYRVRTEVRRGIRYGVAVNASYLASLYESTTGREIPARIKFAKDD